MTHPPHTDAPLDAESLLESSWDRDFLPVDPVSICNLIGIGAYIAPLKEGIDSVVIRDDQGERIYVSTHVSTNRRRYLFARGLGDICQGKSSVCPTEDTSCDEYSDVFARNLLVPSYALRLFREWEVDAEKLPDLFSVDKECVDAQVRKLRDQQLEDASS